MSIIGNIKFRLSLRQRGVALVVIVLASTLLILVNACTLRLTSAVRSYVNGESLYSKGQKDATRQLVMYLHAGGDQYWNCFLASLQVPIGDSLARVALTNGGTDNDAWHGFAQAKNDEEDISDMIWLYRNFKTVPFMKQAISVWREADREIRKLHQLGIEIRSRKGDRVLTVMELRQFTERIEAVSATLDAKEIEFSNILGSGARKVNQYLFYTNVVFTLLIVGSAVWYSLGMVKHLAKANDKLRKTLDFGGLSSGTVDFRTMELTLSAELLYILDMDPLAPRKITLQQFLEYFVAPEDHESLYGKLEAFAGDGKRSEEIEIEFQVTTVRKKEKILRLKAVVLDMQGFAIVQDVTSIRKLELDALARARYIEQILFSITDGFFAVGNNWEITLANKEFERLSGLDASQLTGRSLWDILPVGVHHLVRDKFDRSLYHGETQHFEFSADDVTFDAHVYPHDVGLLVYLRDVSERKRIVSELAEREQHLLNVLHGLPVAVYLTDVSGAITSYNDAAIRLWGRVPDADEKWCGSYRLFTTEGEPISYCNYPTAIAVRKQAPVHNVEAILEQPDGTRVNFIAYATPFHRTSGEFVGAMNVMIDITARLRIEQELKAREKSEERERIANLIEGQELERARLSREMHDGLGQLLNAAQYNLDCLNEQNVTTVKDKVFRLIGETLSESKRISSNLLPLKLIDFDLTTCVSSLCEQLNSGKVRVVFQTQPFKDDFTEQERLTLYRIVQEGLQNAVKHSGCSRIFVQLYRDDDDVHISIEDDGVGFDKSSRIDAGHGLRNIRHRVHVLNGKLEIESSPQFGTLVSVSVPLNVVV